MSLWRRLALGYFYLFLVLTGSSLGCGPGRGSGRRRPPRKKTPLVYKQHVPNVSERNLGASGVAEGPIKKGTPQFKQLVNNSNPEIIFKDEERTGADRLMTQRCKDRLNLLAVAVMNEWPGVRLRVTEAWDEDKSHAKDSLHYEGRAVDITTSDRDRAKYGMLARLAVIADFDWVYYESRGHIHCSVKSDSALTTRTGGCFHGNAIVTLETGERVKLSDVQEGQIVLALDSSGKLVYSEIYMFMHRDPGKTDMFYSIETELGSAITLTPSHLIHVGISNSTSPSDLIPVFAGNVRQGHYIIVTDNNGDVTLSRVTKVTSTIARGVYAPLTVEGTIVIDGVVASCYGVINSHDIAHAAFAPLRSAHYVTSYFRRKIEPHQSNNEVGIHWYADFLQKWAPFVLPSHFWFSS